MADTTTPSRTHIGDWPHWLFPDGTILPVVSGGADEPPPDPPQDPPADPPADPDDDQLGEKGVKALQVWKQRARAAEAAAKERDQLRAELAKLEAANQSEAEKALAAAREEGKREALTAANTRVLRAEVTAAAAGKLSDPADAVKFLDLSEFEIDDDGEVDTQAIAEAIDALVAAKPYLAATAKGIGTGGGGARPQGPNKTIDQQIAEAEAAGDFRTARHLKSQKVAGLMTNNT